MNLPNKICVLSGRYPPSTFSSATNHRSYCYRHNYTYIHCAWPTHEKNPYMNKIAYIREYYKHFDFIFWIDDDAFFLDFEQKLEDFLPREPQFLSVCHSPSFKKLKTFFSSGQFLLKCDETGQAFMDELTKLDFDTVKAWWPHNKYFYTNGDQDKMTYLILNDKRFVGKVKLYDYSAFNSRFENLIDGPYQSKIYVLHFTGTKSKKMADYKRAQKILGYGPSLLPQELENQFNLMREGFVQKVRNFFFNI